MSYEPLHHKYRPKIFADLIGQETIALTLSQAIATEKIAPAYLFTGPRGTGKTSSARILAKSLNCLSSDRPTANPCGECEVCKAIACGTALDVMEIDAASNTGVDNIREIIERSRFAPVQCRYKVYAIDECHMLSTAAFNALLKTLEEPPPQVVFILATTDPQRVLSTIISRCQRFDYRRIPLAEMINHLEYIAKAEKIAIKRDALTSIAQIANGGLRDAESLLDQLSLLPETITVEKVWDLVGAVPERDLLGLLKGIKSDRHTAILEQCRSLLDRGREPLIVLQNLASFYLNLLIAKTAPQSSDLVAVTETCWQELCSYATTWEIGEILRGQQHLKEAETQIKQTTQPRLWLEVTLMGLLPSSYSQQSTVNSQQLSVISHRSSVISHQPANSHQTASKQPATSHQPSTNHHKQPSSSNYQPAAINQQPAIDKVDEGIWQKVIDLLQPPTTKALLSQQCHLISFQGSSAVVGISSAKLQRLHQGKVANIEAAFEKVCQRKIKVRLEVASLTNLQSRSDRQSNLSPSLENQSSEEEIDPDNTVSRQDTDVISLPNHLTSSTVSHLNTKIADSTNNNSANSGSVSDSQIPQVNKTVELINQKRDTNWKTSVPQPSLSVQPKHDPVENHVRELNSATPNELELISIQHDNNLQASKSKDFNPSILQQAIDDLTQSFEGELVELDSINLSQSSDNKTQGDRLNISITDLSSTDAKTVVSGRPDLSEYEDDEDIPFLRPVYSKTNYGSQLCDFWELEANRYWNKVK